MKVRILHLLKGACKSSGMVFFVDVFLAVSFILYLIGECKARKVFIANHKESLELKKANKDYVLISETDSGNLVDFSARFSRVKRESISGKSVILSTYNGTRGINACRNADKIYLLSLLNISSAVSLAKNSGVPKADVISIGIRKGTKRAYEDDICANLFKKWVEGKREPLGREEEIIINILKKRYEDNLNTGDMTMYDFNFVTEIDRYKAVPMVERERGFLVVKQ